MTNRTIDAVVKLSAKLGPMAAFSQLGAKMADVNRKAAAYSATSAKMEKITRAQAMATRMQTTALRGSYAATSAALRYAAPLLAGATIGGAITGFATVERRLTRIGNTIGATRDQMRDMNGDIERTAQAYGLTTDALTGTVEAYAAAGADLPDIAANLDILAKAQQGIDATGADTVNAWDTARKSLKLTNDEAERFFGIIAAGGAAGKFEAKDAAQYLPNILPSVAALGQTGNQAVLSTMGALEVIRDFAGSSEQAATSISDLLDKLTAPDVEKKFANVGISLRTELEKGNAAGEDLYDTLHRIIDSATKGDARNLAKFFSEKDSRRAARVILTEIERIRAAQDEIARNAPTVLDKNVGNILADTQTKLDRLGGSLKKLLNETGGAIADLGLGELMDYTSGSISYAGAVNRGLEKTGRAHGWMERTAWGLTSSADDKRSMAWVGGYRTDEERKAIAAYGEYGQSRAAAPAYVMPRKTLPNAGPVITTRDGQLIAAVTGAAAPLPARRPSEVDMAIDAQDAMRGYGTRSGGVAPAPALPDNLSVRPGQGVPELQGLLDNLERGGKDAADAVSASGDDIARGGETAAQALRTALSDGAREAGASIAAQIKQAASNIRVQTGPGPSAPAPGRDVNGPGDL
jgi:TP901 family phage tail tape measure protein